MVGMGGRGCEGVSSFPPLGPRAALTVSSTSQPIIHTTIGKGGGEALGRRESEWMPSHDPGGASARRPAR